MNILLKNSGSVGCHFKNTRKSFSKNSVDLSNKSIWSWQRKKRPIKKTDFVVSDTEISCKKAENCVFYMFLMEDKRKEM